VFCLNFEADDPRSAPREKTSSEQKTPWVKKNSWRKKPYMLHAAVAPHV